MEVTYLLQNRPNHKIHHVISRSGQGYKHSRVISSPTLIIIMSYLQPARYAVANLYIGMPSDSNSIYEMVVESKVS